MFDDTEASVLNLGGRTGLPPAHQVQLPAGAEPLEVPLSSAEGPPTTHTLSLVWLLVLPELSISPEAFLGCPQQWDPCPVAPVGPNVLFVDYP